MYSGLGSDNLESIISLLNSMIGILDRLSSTQTSKLIKTDYVSAPLERQKILLDLAQQNKL